MLFKYLWWGGKKTRKVFKINGYQSYHMVVKVICTEPQKNKLFYQNSLR